MISRKDSSLLAVDLHEGQIRVAEVQWDKSGGYKVVKAGTVSVAASTFANGSISDYASIGATLRKLLSSLGIRAKRAVFGLPSGAWESHLVTVPPVPDDEMLAVVSGEIEYYKILRPGGSFDFTPLTPPGTVPEGMPVSVSVVNIELTVSEGLRTLASRANLEVSGLEPTAYAMIRSVVALQGEGSHLCLLLGEAKSHVALVSDGKLAFFRRLEVGSRALLGEDTEDFGTSRMLRDTRPRDSRAVIDSHLNQTASDMLITEMQRTISYLQREYSGVFVVDQINLVLDVNSVAVFGQEMEAMLNLPVLIVAPDASVAGTLDVENKFAPETAAEYSGALGLALRDEPSISAVVPTIDLFARERKITQIVERKRSLRASLFFSVIFSLVFGGAYLQFGAQATALEAEHQTLQSQIDGLRQEATEKVATKNRRKAQMKQLVRQGAPVGPIMDYIVASLSSQVGLTSITVDNSLRVVVAGEAQSEQAMIQTAQNLQRSPIFKTVSINSFERADDKEQAGLIKFSLEAKAITADRIVIQGTGGAK